MSNSGRGRRNQEIWGWTILEFMRHINIETKPKIKSGGCVMKSGKNKDKVNDSNEELNIANELKVIPNTRPSVDEGRDRSKSAAEVLTGNDLLKQLNREMIKQENSIKNATESLAKALPDKKYTSVLDAEEIVSKANTIISKLDRRIKSYKSLLSTYKETQEKLKVVTPEEQELKDMVTPPATKAIEAAKQKISAINNFIDTEKKKQEDKKDQEAKEAQETKEAKEIKEFDNAKTTFINEIKQDLATDFKLLYDAIKHTDEQLAAFRTSHEARKKGMFASLQSKKTKDQNKEKADLAIGIQESLTILISKLAKVDGSNLQLMSSRPADDKIKNGLYLYQENDKIYYATKIKNSTTGRSAIIREEITKEKYPSSYFNHLLTNLKSQNPNGKAISEEAEEALLKLISKKGHAQINYVLKDKPTDPVGSLDQVLKMIGTEEQFTHYKDDSLSKGMEKLHKNASINELTKRLERLKLAYEANAKAEKVTKHGELDAIKLLYGSGNVEKSESKHRL